MEFAKLDNTYVLRIDKGEEAVETIANFCKNQNILLGTISGIGATNDATIGLFDTVNKVYHSRELKGDFETAPLSGNITTMKGKTYIHLHANLGDKESRTFSGHLNKAVVSATLEAFIIAVDGEVDREHSEEIGLNLLKF